MLSNMSWTSRIVWGGIILSLLTMMLAALLSRFGVFPFSVGFTGLLIGGGIAAVVAIVALIRMIPVLRDQGKAHLLAGMLIALLVPFFLYTMYSGARAAQPIHDITTDLNNPPLFQTIAPREYEMRLFTETQRRALHEVGYRDLGPLKVAAAVPTATAIALRAVEQKGMKVAAKDLNTGRVEATDTTFWFGFKDDVVIRVTPGEDGGSVIDMRSVSRIGIGDVGANAKRIKALQAAILSALDES